MHLSRHFFFLVFRFGSEFAAKASSFIVFPLMTHYLGSEGYGVHVQISAINSILIPIAILGLNFSAVRVIAGSEDIDFVTARFVSTMLLVAGVSTVLALCVSLAAPLLNDLFIKVKWATPVIRWAAWLIVFTTLERLLTVYYRAQLRIVAYSLLQIVQSVVYVGSVAWIFHRGGGLFEVIQAILAIKIAMVLLMLLYFFWIKAVRFRVSLMPRDDLIEMLRFGLPVIMMSVGLWFISLGDRTVIGYYLNASETGIYGATYTLAGVISLLAAPFGAPLYPLMAAHKNNNDMNGLHRTCRRYSSYFLLVGIPGVLGMIALSTELLQLLSSEEFVTSPFLFAFIILGLFFDYFATNAQYLIYLHNEPKFLRNVTVLTGAVNLGLNVILVPVLGIMGAAVTTFISYVVMDTLLFRRVIGYGYRLQDLYNFRAIGKFILCALVMFAVVYAIKPRQVDSFGALLSVVLVGGGCYGVLLLAAYQFKIKRLLSIT